jgi:imidazolonepropionase-like amidohydrolase
MPIRPVLLRTLLAILLLGLVPPPAGAGAEEDVAAARALFEANLDAIARRDRDAYLATYLRTEGLARTGATGFELGYEGLAASAGESWPAVFEAQDLRLTPVEEGVVYGTYRYRVAYEDEEAPGGLREVAGLSERIFIATPEGWRIAVTTAFEAPPGTPPPPRALVGATLVDGTGAAPVADAVVLLRDGRIDCAGPRDACPVPEGVDTVDLAGHWVTPGLVDAHVHFSQTGWAGGRPDALDVRGRYPYAQVVAGLEAHPERFFRSWLCSGVTAVFDVGGYPWTLDLPARAESDTRAPRVAAAGPLLSTWDFWLNLPAERQFVYLTDAAAARQGVDYLADRGADAVKVWYIPVEEREPEAMAAAVAAAGEEAQRRGLPLIVHATGLEEAKTALRAGARLLVHSVWDREVDEEFLGLAREAGALYTPTLTVPDGYQRMFEAVAAGNAPAVDDPHGCVDPETLRKVAETADPEVTGEPPLGPEALARRRAATARRAEIGARNLRRVHAAGIPVAMGTDAGNPLTLHGPSVYAEMEAMQAAGLSPMEVLVAATRNGARAMGRGDELGTVEAGKLADLVILAADPTEDIAAYRQLRWVVRGGVLRPVEELRAQRP